MNGIMKKKLILCMISSTTTLCPLAIRQSPSSNFDERKDIKTHKLITKPTHIIIHYTTGCTAKKAYYSLSNFFRPVSAHYVIAANGTVSQLVDESTYATAGPKSYLEAESL